MTSPAVTVGSETPLAEAARIMRERGVKRLPVVDEASRIVGIVSRSDLLAVFARGDEVVVLHAHLVFATQAGALVEPDETARATVHHAAARLEARGLRVKVETVAARSAAQAVTDAAERVSADLVGARLPASVGCRRAAARQRRPRGDPPAATVSAAPASISLTGALPGGIGTVAPAAACQHRGLSPLQGTMHGGAEQ